MALLPTPRTFLSSLYVVSYVSLSISAAAKNAAWEPWRNPNFADRWFQAFLLTTAASAAAAATATTATAADTRTRIFVQQLASSAYTAREEENRKEKKKQGGGKNESFFFVRPNLSRLLFTFAQQAASVDLYQ